MGEWFNINFGEMFTFRRPPLDTLLRGTLVYLAICVLLRVIPKRQAGKLSPSDLIVVVLLGGIATTALEMAPMSVPDVLLVMATILFWSFALDWLAYHFPRLRPLIQELPTRLIQDGQLLAQNLRRELVTEEEVRAQLRTQGIHDIRDIKQACLEADGSISVVKDDGKQPPGDKTTDAARCHADDAADRPGLDEPAEPGRPPSEVAPPIVEAENGKGPPSQEDEQAQGPDGLEAEVSEFLGAADRLQRRVQWHQRQIDSHRAGIHHLKTLLAEHGVRGLSSSRRKLGPVHHPEGEPSAGREANPAHHDFDRLSSSHGK